MFGELSIYLENTVSPERYELIRSAMECLSKTEDRSYEDKLMELLDVSDNMGDTQTLASMEVLLREYVTYNLKRFGVVLTEEDLTISVPIFKAVQSIEDFDDPTAVVDTCEEESSPELIMAHLIELVNYVPWIEHLTVIESISPSLIDRIQDLAAGKEDIFELKASDYEFDVTPYSIRLRRFVRAYPGKATLILSLLEDGYTVGRDIDDYLDAVAENIDGFSPEDTTLEFIAIALASNVDDSDIERMVGFKIEELFDDLDLLMRAKNSVSKFLIGVNDE